MVVNYITQGYCSAEIETFISELYTYSEYNKYIKYTGKIKKNNLLEKD